MSSKITIIGAGSVGATIAYKLSGEDIASEIVLIDINKEKVEGEVMDIKQGTCFRNPISIIAGDYKDAAGSDIVIITSGIARKPGQTRIIGSGTVLDTARLRSGLSEHFHVAQKNIHAYVFGEHGDSSFVPWSSADIASMSLDDYYTAMSDKVGIEKLNKDAMVEYVHKSGGQVIAKKGATFYAVAVAVCELCNMVLAASDSIATVSSMMHGEYGIDDVCLSTLTLIGPNGVKGRVPARLTEEETEKLKASAKVLKDVIAQIEI